MPDNCTSADLPASYQAADAASQAGQRRYLRLVQFNLAVLVIAGALGAVSWRNTDGRDLAALLTFLSTVLATAALGFITFSGQEHVWFGCRAIAESIKSLAWRFMAGGTLYPITLPAREAGSRLSQDILAAVRAQPAMASEIGSRLPQEASEVTSFMRRVRSSPFAERVQAYLEQRLRQQRIWYAAKARWNLGRRNFWFVIIWLAHLAAVLAAGYYLANSAAPLNLTSPLAALAAACFSWLQVKQHQVLMDSYGMAAQELSVMESLAAHATTEEDLSRLVAQAEDAISREHKMWIAKTAGRVRIDEPSHT